MDAIRDKVIDSMVTLRKVNAAWARQVAELLDARGRPTRQILQEVGLDPEELRQEDARIPYRKHVALLEAAARRLDDPNFGLHFGAGVDMLEAGVLAYVAANSPDLGQAIKNLLTYFRLGSDGARARLEVENGLAFFIWEVLEPQALGSRHNNETTLTVAMQFFRFLVGRHVGAQWVEFRHDRKESLADFARYFGGEVRFACGRNVIVLPEAHLSLPCKNADPRLLRIVKAHCDDLLAKLGPDTGLRDQVEHIISCQLIGGSLTAKRVAEELAMSERTFARRLAEQGTSFGQLLDQVRRRLAERYLSEPDAKANQVSYMLGYREPAAFTTAFRRWTGPVADPIPRSGALSRESSFPSADAHDVASWSGLRSRRGSSIWVSQSTDFPSMPESQ